MTLMPKARPHLPKPAFLAMAITTGAFVISAVALILGAPVHDLIVLGLCVAAMISCLAAFIVTFTLPAVRRQPRC